MNIPLASLPLCADDGNVCNLLTMPWCCPVLSGITHSSYGPHLLFHRGKACVYQGQRLEQGEKQGVEQAQLGNAADEQNQRQPCQNPQAGGPGDAGHRQQQHGYAGKQVENAVCVIALFPGDFDAVRPVNDVADQTQGEKAKRPKKGFCVFGRVVVPSGLASLLCVVLAKLIQRLISGGLGIAETHVFPGLQLPFRPLQVLINPQHGEAHKEENQRRRHNHEAALVGRRSPIVVIEIEQQADQEIAG